MNFSLNPFINEFDSISSPSDLYSSNDDISEVFLDILFQDKQDVNENNIKIRLEPFFKVEKDHTSQNFRENFKLVKKVFLDKLFLAMV